MAELLLSDVDDIAVLRQVASSLYDLLDDIDTAGDVAKSNNHLYRTLVEDIQAKKSASGVYSDGYRLLFDLDRMGDCESVLRQSFDE